MSTTAGRFSLVICAFCSLASAQERVWGLRGEFMALKQGSSDVAVLKTDSGATLEIPLASLSDADRQWISKLASVPAVGGASNPVTVIKGPLGKNLSVEVPASLVSVESDAVFCRTAKEAVQVYRMFLAKPDLRADVRKAGDTRLEHWRRLAAEDRVRCGERWIPLAEREDIARKTEDMVRHARELLRLGHFKLAGEELRKASKLDPESGKADFFLGWVYSLGFNEDERAAEHFREVIRREPANPWAHSNLAVSELFCKQSANLFEHFEKALETMPQPQIVADNIGVAIALASRRTLRIPDKPLRDISDLYRRAIREMSLAPLPDNHVLRFTYVSPFGKAWEGKTGSPSADGREAQEVPEDAALEIGSGTGFVLAPGFILTNQHVVEGADAVVIVDPADRASVLDATVVASTKDADLALVKCERLKAAALPLRAKLPSRGTDIMVLGYPGGSRLGLELKTTRGSIVSNSDPEWNGLFLLSATINKGNSGGPIVDASGTVVGVVAAYTRREFMENTYSLGIPIDIVWPFITDHLPDLAPAEDGKELPWPEVDASASPGTVFIQVKRKKQSSE